MASQLFAIGSLLIVSFLWGSSFVAIKIAATGFGPIEIAALRVSIAAMLLLSIWMFYKEKISLQGSIIWRIVFLSLIGQIMPFVALGASGHLTDSGSMAVMMGLAPFATMVMAGMTLQDERWTWDRWLALVIGFGGVVMALGVCKGGHAVWAVDGDGRDVVGKLLAGLAALGYAGGALLSRSITRSLSPLGTCAISMTLSALALWFFGSIAGMNLVGGKQAPWLSVIVLGIFNTAAAYVIYFYLISKAGATFASLNNYIVPVLGVFIGAIILDEIVSSGSVIGLALVFLSLFMYSRPKKQTASAKQDRQSGNLH